MTLQQLKQQLATATNFQDRKELERKIAALKKEQKKKASNDSQPKLF